MLSTSGKVAAVLAATSALFVGFGATQSQPAYQTRNLTPDGFWHNRYHAILSMAAYGPYEETCPVQTFTEANKLKNFPNSTRPAWTVLETWKTPSGCEGFAAIVPEMNKALLVFRGNHELELTLDTAVSSWDELGSGIGATCEGCTMNSFALQGYLEAKAATNNWAITRAAYAGQGLVFSITGHGLGGMHSLIASADFNYQQICYYSHTYASPRTFNHRGAVWYNARFNGEAGERGIFNNDQYSESIAEGPNYAHSGTLFYYWGVNATSGGQPNWKICWNDDLENGITDPATCLPGYEVGNVGSTAEQDKYFYFTPVGECGRPAAYNLEIINDFLEFEAVPGNADATFNYVGDATAVSTSTRYTQTSRSSTRTRSTVYFADTTTVTRTSTSSRRPTPAAPQTMTN